MLHKLLAKDRHFFPDSVWKYLALTQWFPTGEEFLPGEEFPLYSEVTKSLCFN